jgi:hypothetical protein
VELIWNAEAAEFDGDVKANERAMFQADTQKVQRKFDADIVKLRRIRQLADLGRARRQGPSFEGETTEDEREVVRRDYLPRYETAGWQLRGPVEKMFAGVIRYRDLCEGIDPNSALLVRLMLGADSDAYREQAKRAYDEQVGAPAPCNPFDTGCLPLSFSGNPGVNWRILQGCVSGSERAGTTEAAPRSATRGGRSPRRYPSDSR